MKSVKLYYSIIYLIAKSYNVMYNITLIYFLYNFIINIQYSWKASLKYFCKRTTMSHVRKLSENFVSLFF